MSLQRHFPALELSLSAFFAQDPIPLGDGELAGTRVMQQADAEYEVAVECAEEQGLKLPMV